GPLCEPLFDSLCLFGGLIASSTMARTLEPAAEPREPAFAAGDFGEIEDKAQKQQPGPEVEFSAHGGRSGCGGLFWRGVEQPPGGCGNAPKQVRVRAVSRQLLVLAVEARLREAVDR